jgi:hypothetical protein
MAPKLSDFASLPGYPNFNTLVGCLPETIAAEAKLHQLALARGIEYKIADFGGLRTPGITDLILFYRDNDYAAAVRANPAVAKIPKEKWRPISPYLKSRHRFGSAFDIIPTKLPKGMSTSVAMQTLGTLAEKYCNLRWGGNFPEDRIDVKHFELTPPMSSLEIAWDAFQRGAGTAVASAASVVKDNRAVTSILIMLVGALVLLRTMRA